MGLLDRIWNDRGQQVDFTSWPDTARYDMPLFLDRTIQELIRSQGFARISLFGQEEIIALQKVYEEFELKAGGYLREEFLSSGRINDPELRSWLVGAIAGIIDAKLSSIFEAGKAEIFSGSFLVKPAGRKSGLSPHQDSSLTDEQNHFAVYGWIPLVSTNVRNGTLFVIPGSHRFGNIYRSLNIPWKFREYEKVMKNHAVHVPAGSGDIIFFDSALIHGSAPNLSGNIRVAVNTFVKPRGIPFLHHYKDDNTPEGKVEEFQVDLGFFNTCNILERPPAQYPIAALREDNYPVLDKQSFKMMIEYFKPGKLIL